MSFWDSSHLKSLIGTSIIDDCGRFFSFQQFDKTIQEAADFLSQKGSRMVGFIVMRNSYDCVVAYLSCLRSGHVPLLLSESISSDLIESLIQAYQPDWIISENFDGACFSGTSLNISFRKSIRPSKVSVHQDLALLLSTSGSTGSPKLVRLSYSALQGNAESIVDYLDIRQEDRALTVLPCHYSFGLSVINSHILAGASIHVRDVSVLSADFLSCIRDYSVTSISGVPATYQMLIRSGFGKKDLPSLNKLTQAGGRLSARMAEHILGIAEKYNWKFFVMYGQTEATARISYVPPNLLASKIDSIGVPIPGGCLQIDPVNSELIYKGKNVMLGYAQSYLDLSKGDELCGILRTGDVGKTDNDGFFYITGRLKRFVKLAGNRVNLDEVEAFVENTLGCVSMVVGQDDRMQVHIKCDSLHDLKIIEDRIIQTFNIHYSMFSVSQIAELPLLSSGKKDYHSLNSES